MFKHLLTAGVAVAALAAAVVATAQPAPKTYTDPQNRFSFQYPASLPLDVAARPNQPVNVIVGAADYECQMFVVDRPDSANKAAADMVRAYSTPFGPDIWKRSADGFALYGRQGVLDSQETDTSRFWPIHRAKMHTADGKAVIGAMQMRRGVEVWQFCTGFDSGDHTAVFTQIINSFAGPTDAADAQEASAAQAANAAAAAAAAAAAEAEAAAASKAKKSKRGTRNLATPPSNAAAAPM